MKPTGVGPEDPTVADHLADHLAAHLAAHRVGL